MGSPYSFTASGHANHDRSLAALPCFGISNARKLSGQRDAIADGLRLNHPGYAKQAGQEPR